MNKSQALELAYSFFMPDFLFADGIDAVKSEMKKTEEAIKALTQAYFEEENPDFEFADVLVLADRDKELADMLGESGQPRGNSCNINRALSIADITQSIAALQKRPVSKVESEILGNKDNIATSYISSKVKGTVVGIDIETTAISPDRGYILNVGYELYDLKQPSEPYSPFSAFSGLPEQYKETGVPLERIHHINWNTIEGKKQFREDKELQAQILKVLESHPYMAHNAAFEDSWFMLNLEGYAEGRKAGRIIPIDTRDICRKLDPDVARLPRESSPAALENWARRRGVLGANEVEYHQGLEDVDLMLKTVSAEFDQRNMY